MLRISQAPEPSSFHRKVTVKGNAYLANHPNTPASKLRDFWNDYRTEFYDVYHGICAYTATKIIKEHGFQIDHFLPKSIPRYRSLAYTWSNLRLAAPLTNLQKRKELISDPFTIPDNACQIGFLKGRIKVNQDLPAAERRRLVKTLRLLQLNQGAALETRLKAFCKYRRFVKNRSEGNASSQRDCMDIEHLTRWYPFVASEMLRIRKIAPEDCTRCRQILSELGFDGF